MDGEENGQVPAPYFYVGQHETRRVTPVTEHVLQQAKECGVRDPVKVSQTNTAKLLSSMICSPLS